MDRRLPLVDYALCMACIACIPACPFSCLDLERRDGSDRPAAFPLLARPQDCTGCGLCAKACPVDCISMTRA
jgi:NAD-dependent dihydropyrimidine dehydrogenase PreA subunit